MKGGYLEDRHNDGSDNEKAFRFFMWSSIDVFVYFSHNLVTIPPISWINASHKNGVPILGTFIVEGFHQTNPIMDQILDKREIMENVVSKLVAIAQHYCFEGWLINIECKIDPKYIESLITFTKLLTDAMHSYDSQSLVIWYDSVVSPEGHLEWQNELNERNKCFFDSCDGIFLNYCWNQNHLNNSYDFSKKFSRNYDVFVGIDVFGRNCFGGGGMNTHLAVKEVLKHNLSIAIFASGWTHEVLGSENFTDNEYRFWSSLGLRANHWPKSLPLITSFCQGFGTKLYKRGEILANKCWHNLNLQELQPTFHDCVQINVEQAFNGGGCLQLNQSSLSLFQCELPIERCFYGITYKSNSGQKIETLFKYQTNESLENKTFNLFFTETNRKINNEFKVEYINDYRKHKSLEKLIEFGIFETTNGWETQAFIIEKTIANQVLVTNIDLIVRKSCSKERVGAPDVLIGQIILDSI